MNEKDLYNLLTVSEAIAPAAHAADNTPAAVDLAGFSGALVVIHIGVGGITFDATHKVEFKLTHSEDDATYTDVAVDDVTGLASVGSGGIIKSLIAAHAAATVTEVGYKGGKRYLKLLADFSGTHGVATPLSAVVIKGGKDILP